MDEEEEGLSLPIPEHSIAVDKLQEQEGSQEPSLDTRQCNVIASLDDQEELVKGGSGVVAGSVDVGEEPPSTVLGEPDVGGKEARERVVEESVETLLIDEERTEGVDGGVGLMVTEVAHQVFDEKTEGGGEEVGLEAGKELEVVGGEGSLMGVGETEIGGSEDTEIVGEESGVGSEESPSMVSREAEVGAGEEGGPLMIGGETGAKVEEAHFTIAGKVEGDGEEETLLMDSEKPEVVGEEALGMVEVTEEVAKEAVTVGEEVPLMDAENPDVVSSEDAKELEVVGDEAPLIGSVKPEVMVEETHTVVAEMHQVVVVPHEISTVEKEPEDFGEEALLMDSKKPEVADNEASLMVAEMPKEPSMGTAEPEVVGEEVPSMAAEEPEVVGEEVPSMAAEEPEVVGEGVPSVAAEKPEDVKQFQVAEEAEVSGEEAPLMDVEKPEIVGNEIGAVEEAPLVAAEEAKLVGEEVSSMVVDDSDNVGEEQHSPVADEPLPEPDTEMDMDTETEVTETRKSSGKRKRGRPAKLQAKPPVKKTTEEDVCFICFDGGDLVLCDRRGCPKAYHPACINRDEAFFRSKGRWSCGWHICSNCEKAAQYTCYTCTYSLCKGCIKEAEFYCVRGNKGFCGTCRRTVTLIEKNEQGNNETAQVNFDDKSSWEYLFKDYWLDLKRKLSISSDELSQARNPWRGSNASVGKEESSEDIYDANDDQGSDSENSSGHRETSNSKKRRPKRQSKASKEVASSVTQLVGEEGTSTSNNTEWASEELLEFVAHMRNGDKSFVSQFDVQALLLEYIKQNNLRDPKRKSQILCDTRFANLFGKSRVGHFEMLKLIENHFLVKEDTQAENIQMGNEDTEASQLDADGSSGSNKKDKRRKTRKRGDGRGPQTNLDDYAAIDVHNIKLLYLRRNLMEDLLEDSDKFPDKVVGAFVRIRISGSGQKQDMYRLVPVVGTRKAAEPYKTGKRTTDIVLEILNLNKTEIISMDTISNQDFSEDECKRLRQSIKCGLISRMTVGEVQEKAMTFHAVRANDLLEAEKLRVSHLRDRASEQGRRKELRECVEKLQLLNTPEERTRRLQEVPEIHDDPHMDPNYESEEDEAEPDDKQRDHYMRPRDAGFTRKGREPISPGKGSPASIDIWSGARKNAAIAVEPGRNVSTKAAWDKRDGAGERTHESPWSHGKDVHQSNSALDTGAWSGQAVVPDTVQAPPTVVPNFSEADKIWHYKDPAGKIQGPFSMVQLRKWSTTGYFPVDMRIWKINEMQEDSILLNDALKGKFTKELPQTSINVVSGNNREYTRDGGWNSNENEASQAANENSRLVNGSAWGSGSFGQSAQPHQQRVATLDNRPSSWVSPAKGWNSPPSVETPKLASGGWAIDQVGRTALSNLPSPTPKMSSTSWPSEASQDDRRDFSSPPTPTPGPANTGGWGPSAPAPVLSGSLMNTGNGHKPQVDNQGWGNLPSPTPSSALIHVAPQPQANDPYAHNSAPTFGAVPQIGTHLAAGFPPGPPNINSNHNNVNANLNMQTPVQVNPGWGMGGNQNPNPGWGAAPGNQTAVWMPPQQNPNMGQGNATMAWGAVPPANPNAVQGAMLQGNVNTGWGPPAANTGPWGNQPKQSRDRNSQGADSRHGGGRSSWNRQPSFGSGDRRGGGSTGPPPRSGICRFHQSGHCKKGANCNHPHS